MRWVVLSDLHMNYKNFDTKDARKKLLDALKKENEKGSIDFVLVTGDCLHQNQGEISEIRSFIIEISKACRINYKKVFICPGNHDVDRNNSVRNEVINLCRKSNPIPNVQECLNGYPQFKELYSMIFRNQYKPFWAQTVGDFRIIRIDSCLLSKDDKDYGQLRVGFPELFDFGEKNIRDDEKINIVFMHHGVEWLQMDDGRRFQHWLAKKNVKMVFCGHNHAPGMSILTEGITDNSIPRDGIPQFTCGCVLSDSYSKPVFLVGNYTERKFFDIKMYEYKENSRWEIADGELRSFPQGVYQESTRDGLIRNSYDIPKVYSTIFDLGDYLSEEIKYSSKLDFFGLRGRSFIRGNSKIANALYDKKEQIICRFLVSDPYSPNIEKRLRNVPEFSTQSKLEQQWRNIYQGINALQNEFPNFYTWKIRFHTQPILFRFIMTDQNVYFGYYAKEPSSKSPMYCYSNHSTIYRSLKDYFDSAWDSANTNFSMEIPDRCSFVLEKFGIKPSLVINLASDCNMKCRYCPVGGESLKECNELCDIIQIKYLLKAYADYYRKQDWKEKKVIRITGGEPLLNEDRLNEVLKSAKINGYEKIVLCTNGTLLKKCYEDNPDLWDSVKSILLLKISLDSMKEDVFYKLTQSNKLDVVLQNIQFAKSRGFKIELNFVATKDNIDEIETIYDYAYKMGLVGLKVLTINDFGGRVKVDDVENELNGLISNMRSKNYLETGLYVHNNKGIHMKRFIHNGCTLTIVDHMNNADSVTPRRTYSSTCKNCKYYPDSIDVKRKKAKPCATGIMSLTMRADGMLSFCRMDENSGEFLSGKSLSEVSDILSKQMENFKNCYHYQIGEKNEKI